MADGWRVHIENGEGTTETPGLLCYEIENVVSALSGYASAFSLLPPAEATHIVITPVENVETVPCEDEGEDVAA